ncbi:hypothetical protein VUJ46_11455 [Chryseobacterium sp. MYb264]|uniref:hypothetical protein n=1 Tax=Chryseobacterium sp. MYb264 TaxID=2745153 RepID=UPI002E15A492|nr:hypothetical protein VUJ46_11455 [Chryseobacterium sp. MYb264]
MIKKLITLGLFSVSMFSFAQENQGKTQSESRFTIIPSVGYAWRTAKIAEGLSKEEKNYVKGLKSGMNFDISAYYQVNKILSVGLKYSNFSASSDGYILGYVNGMPFSVPVTTKDHIHFYGPAVMISNFNEATRHKMFVDMGLGVITYTTKTATVKGTGSNLGAELNLGYQYQVTKNIHIGPKLGLTAGTLNKMKIDGVAYELGEGQKEGLARLSLSAAAAFRF